MLHRLEELHARPRYAADGIEPTVVVGRVRTRREIVDGAAECPVADERDVHDDRWRNGSGAKFGCRAESSGCQDQGQYRGVHWQPPDRYLRPAAPSGPGTLPV